MAGAISGACDFARWEGLRPQLIEAVRNHTSVIAPLTFLPFCDDGALRRICSEAFATDQAPSSMTPLWNGERYGHDRIRIAYLSADFHQHATAELIAGLIEGHDRTAFEVTGISFSRDDGSPMRTRIVQAFDRFEDVRKVADADVARLLREREIDIAVDLKVH